MAILADYLLFETSGTVIADNSGNGHNGTFEGGKSNVVSTTGPSAGLPLALTFDGSVDRINIPYDASFTGNSVMTLAATMRFDVAGEGGGDQAACGTWDGASLHFRIMWRDSLSNLTCNVRSSSGHPNSEMTGDRLGDYAWHTVVYTYDGAGCSAYFDGVQTGSEPSQTGVTGYGTYDFSIGAQTPSGSAKWTGDISRVQLADHVFTAQEISDFAAFSGPGLGGVLPSYPGNSSSLGLSI